MTHVIVLGNEKGGSGKSTAAMHIVVALLKSGHRVAAIDLDMRQRSLSRYIENRRKFSESKGKALVFPVEPQVRPSSIDSREAARAEETEALTGALRTLSDCDYVVIDCPGADTHLSRLAHAHADTLSFELSLGTERVIVNGGTSQYGTGPERLRQRGTANHSTLMLDKTNSSEVWSGFRVARRARIISAEAATSSEDVIVRGEHDGYARLQGRPLHARQWTLTDTGLTVADEVTGRGTHRIDVLFHLAPDIIAEREDSGIALYRHAADAPIARVCSAGELKIVQSSWHPNFGTQVASQCLLLSGTHDLPFVNQTKIRWDPS